MLAGKDASLALATMKTDVKDTGKPDDLSKLTELQKRCLASWEGTFKGMARIMNDGLVHPGVIFTDVQFFKYFHSSTSVDHTV